MGWCSKWTWMIVLAICALLMLLTKEQFPWFVGGFSLCKIWND